MPDKIKSKYQFTGDIDNLTLKGGNPFNAYWEDRYLTPQIVGDTIAYSNGDNIWRVPLDKIYPVNDDDLTPQQRLERDWRKSPAYGIDKVILGTLAGTMTPFAIAEAAPALAGLATGASDAAMATRAGQAVYQGLTSPVGKAALSSVFGGMGAHNFFSDNGYAKTLQEWNNLKNDPNFYNAVNFGKSALGDAMDVTMMAPLYKPLTYAGKEMWNTGRQGVEGAWNWAAQQGSDYARARQLSRAFNNNVDRAVLQSNPRYIRSYTGYDGRNYDLFDSFGEPIGNATIEPSVNGSKGFVGWIGSGRKDAHKVTEDIYNTAVQDITSSGGEGLVSGYSLLSPQKTLHVTEKFPHKVIGQSEGHDVRLLTDTTDRPLPQKINGNHYQEVSPGTEIKYNEITGDYEEVPIQSDVKEPPTLSWEDLMETKDNAAFLEKLNAFANKYGYDALPKGNYSREDLNAYAKAIIDRHNSFYRGVEMPTTEEDLAIVRQALGDNATKDEILQYVATHGRMDPQGETSSLWVSPKENAFIYGKDGTARVTRPYTLGNDRMKWFDVGEGDYPLTAKAREASWDDFSQVQGMVDPWHSPQYDMFGNPISSLAVEPNELIASNQPMIFRNWADEYIPLSNKKADTVFEATAPKITEENAMLISPEEWNRQFRAAEARRDVEEGQRLRDLHAAIAQQDNPVNGKVFAHSGDTDYNVFDASHFGETDEGYHGKGFYFSNTRVPEDPSVYSDKMTFGPHGEVPTMNYGPIKKYYYLYGDRVVQSSNPETNYFGTNDIAVTSQRNLDSGKPAEIIIGKPEHIKSADAFTYDDNGNLIDITERDNLGNKDSRYGWIPWLAGAGTAGTLYGISQDNTHAYGGPLVAQANMFGDGSWLLKALPKALIDGKRYEYILPNKYINYWSNATPLKATSQQIKDAYNEAKAFAEEYYNSPGFKQRFSNISKLSKNGQFDQSINDLETPTYYPGHNSYNSENVGYPSQSKPYHLAVHKTPLKTRLSLDNSTAGPHYNNSNHIIDIPSTTMGINNYNDLVSTITHEFGHAIDDALKVKMRQNGYEMDLTGMRPLYSDFFPIFRQSKSNKVALSPYKNRSVGIALYDNSTIGHDAQPTESYADLFTLRKMLKDSGIFDSTKANQVFTKEMLNKFKKEVFDKDPSKSYKYRLFHNFSDNDIIWMINNVAQNDYLPENNEGNNYAAEGGPLVQQANMFEIGGPKKKVRWNTTGGAGYIPPTTGLSMSDVRERLYNNLTPFDYDRPVGRFADAVLANRKDEFIRDDGYLKTADDAWATYLNIPQDKRHNIPGKIILEKSPYYPANTYRMKNLSPEAQQALVDDMQGRQVAFDENIKAYYPEPLKVGEHKITYSPDEDIDNNLRSFTLGRGYDDKGDYAYYRDKFDIAPFGKHEGDQSMGIGTPFNFYDRIYLDDFYGVDSPTHALYLPEVEVEGKKKHGEGGSLNTYKSWNDLSIKEKSEMMKVAIRNGITNLADIKAKYNEFAEGGNLYSGINTASQQMKQRLGQQNLYGDIRDIISMLAKDGVYATVTSWKRPGAVVRSSGVASHHRDGNAIDIVPTNGSTFDDIFRALYDPNSYTSRWMLNNRLGALNETRTGNISNWKPDGKDHSHIHIGIDSGLVKKYAARMGGLYQPYQIGNYRDIAKQHIRQNEGWSATPYADGPNGWRSVGYGFNDSGFRTKYPGGIANYYAQRGGITKAEAERELDWFLNNMEASLRKTYGRRWDSFSDNQKAAIMDTAYQRPASVDAKSAFYAAVMSGNPNAGNLLGVKGFDKRNADRRNLFSSSAVQAMNPQNYGQQQPQMADNPFEGWQFQNESILNGSYNPERDNIIMNQAQQLAQLQTAYDRQEKERLLAAQQQAKAEEGALQRNRTNLALQMVGMMGSDDGSSEFDMLRSLLGNMGAYGGHLYDGWTEPTQQMKKRYYKTVPTGITDKIVQQGGDPLKARLEDGTELSVEDMGNYYAYSNGDNVWRVPKVEGTLLSDLSNVSIQEEENNDFTNAWSGGVEGLTKPEYYNSLVNPFGQALRDRMYRTVAPTGYTIDNALNFIKGNPRSYLDLNTEALYGKYLNQDSIYGTAEHFPQYYYDNSDDTYLTFSHPGRKASFKEIGYPDSLMDAYFRKAAVSDLIKPSSIEKGAYELVYPWASEFPKKPSVGKSGRFHNTSLGTFGFDAEEDEKGMYIKYKDRWDINPWVGTSKEDSKFFSNTNLGLNDVGDIVPWGEPFDVSGKFYRTFYGPQLIGLDGKPVTIEGVPIRQEKPGVALETIKEMIKRGVVKSQSLEDSRKEMYGE